MKRFIAAVLTVLAVCAVTGPSQAQERLIATIEGYAAETEKGEEHVERWKRVLGALGVGTHADPMTAAEAQTYADRGWDRWLPVVGALEVVEAANKQPNSPVQVPALARELVIAIAGGLVVILITAIGSWVSAGGLIRILGGASQSQLTELQGQLEQGTVEREALIIRITHLESQKRPNSGA